MTEEKQPVIGIVNNDAAVRDSLRFLLEVAGHIVETFASAAELLKPSAILRPALTANPRCSSQLESPPPIRHPTAAAAKGIHATEPTALMSNPRASSRYFGNQNI